MPTPPIAPKNPVRIEQVGRTRTDDYAWMKDENWQEVLRDPSVLGQDIRAHLEAENAYFEATLASTEGLQKTMFDEMVGRIKQDDSTVPTPDGPWAYFSRYEAGAQYPRYVRTPREGGTEELLLDAQAEGEGLSYYAARAARHSPDHELFAWAEDRQGSEVYTVVVKDLATGERLPNPVESCTGNFTFSADSEWLFWTYKDENGRPTKVYRRPTRGGEDVLVYEEADPGLFVSVGKTASDAYVVISIGNQETSEARVVPMDDPTADPVVFAPRIAGVRYEIDHGNGRFVVLTDQDALDFKLMFAPEDRFGREHWTPWVEHRPGTFIVGMRVFDGNFVRLERENALNRIVIATGNTLDEHVVSFDEEAYDLSLGGGFEYGTTTLRFTYESPTTPRQWFDYDMIHRSRVLRKTLEVPSGHDPNDYVASRLQAIAPDGETVPITVLRHKDTPIDGSAPTMLYGYGSYGFAMDASFATARLSLVDRGWIWAIAHVRGGSEKGWGWFQDGRKENKPNTFTDFVAVADHLIAEGYASKGRLVAYGGSAGGLLVGAVTNLRPELWAGVIAAVPFVDVLNTMSDTSLPLTPPEWPEWGNPLESAADYDLIASYCPYTQVEPKDYPAVFAYGGLSDPRVTYWEPAKWVAKLREHTTGDDPILLHTNMDAGHGGASGRFERLKEVARDYAFAIWAMERQG